MPEAPILREILDRNAVFTKAGLKTNHMTEAAKAEPVAAVQAAPETKEEVRAQALLNPWEHTRALFFSPRSFSIVCGHSGLCYVLCDLRWRPRPSYVRPQDANGKKRLRVRETIREASSTALFSRSSLHNSNHFIRHLLTTTVFGVIDHCCRIRS